MEDTAHRINKTLANEEAEAERLVNSGRITLLFILTFLALINIKSVYFGVNIMNSCVLATGYTYGLIVFIRW